MPKWERLQKGSRRLDSEPSIGVSARGELNLNRAALDQLGEPERVEVLFDRQEMLIGLRAVKGETNDGYAVWKGESSWRVSPKALTRLFGLDRRPPRRYKARMIGDVLTIDLKEGEPLEPAGHVKSTTG